jgi:hypothetical protein
MPATQADRVGIIVWFGVQFWLRDQAPRAAADRAPAAASPAARPCRVLDSSGSGLWQFVWLLERQRERKRLGPARFRLRLAAAAQQSVALGEGASSFIEGGMEGVPPAKWQQSGQLSSGIEEEAKA